jgi:hypothetical protein
MVSVLFDSNIVIDQTLGIDEASAEMAAYDDSCNPFASGASPTG